MDMDVSDAELVDRTRRGDPAAFDALVRRHLRAAYAVALARVGEPADAEDVCQEAFLSALRRIDDCRQPERFAAWLLRIVRNRASDFVRGRKVRDASPLESVPAPASGADPLREAAREELQANLLEAMEGLTELQREVLLLFDVEGWSHREIAERLGISEGSARVHLHNGRRALRERLGDRYREEG
jgi:RNA polymerase sigma-70 factor (ECF subfamily)